MLTTELAAYSLVRADHPNNMKKGGVCVYYKDFLPLIKKGLVMEIIVDNKKCFFYMSL